MFKQSYLTWSDYTLNDGIREIRKPRNSLCKQLTMRGWRSTILPCFFAFMWTIEQSQNCSPLFWIQQHEGEKMLIVDWTSNARVFVCMCAWFRAINGTVESAHFIQLSNLIKSLPIISPKNPLEIEKNYLSPSKGQIFSQLFCVAHS